MVRTCALPGYGRAVSLLVPRSRRPRRHDELVTAEAKGAAGFVELLEAIEVEEQQAALGPSLPDQVGSHLVVNRHRQRAAVAQIGQRIDGGLESELPVGVLDPAPGRPVVAIGRRNQARYPQLANSSTVEQRFNPWDSKMVAALALGGWLRICARPGALTRRLVGVFPVDPGSPTVLMSPHGSLARGALGAGDSQRDG